MNKIEGMKEAFSGSKQVFLTTTNKKGVSNVRPMTNYNESPYQPMWFPSFLETQKVQDIKEKPEVVISFPTNEKGRWYRVEGKAKLAPWKEVHEKWKWWYLEWLPEGEREKHMLRYDDSFTDRTIIWVDPVEASIGESK
jgi:general stress protein 26